MADSNFNVKNSLVANGSFIANSTQVSLSTINATSNGVLITPISITVGNSSVNSSINATFFNGSSNNTLYVGTISSANVVSNSQLSSNLANYVNTSANYTVSGNINFTGTNTNFANLSVGANVLVNTSTIFVGNNINNTVINGSGLLINGVGIGSYVANTQIFTSSGTWNRPTNYNTNDVIMVMVWGAGGGAQSNGSAKSGGGGACVQGWLTMADVGSTATVTVGTSATNTGGGSSVFAGTSKTITAYGGGAGVGGGGISGGGGGWFSAGTGNGGDPQGGGSLVTTVNFSINSYSISPDSIYGGGYRGGNSIWGGGGGGGGNSIWGGGGGQGNSTGTVLGGTSVFGGNGGGVTANIPTPASAPGGGGSANGTVGLAGARGEVRVYVFRSITSNTA